MPYCLNLSIPSKRRNKKLHNSRDRLFQNTQKNNLHCRTVQNTLWLIATQGPETRQLRTWYKYFPFAVFGSNSLIWIIAKLQGFGLFPFLFLDMQGDHFFKSFLQKAMNHHKNVCRLFWHVLECSRHCSLEGINFLPRKCSADVPFEKPPLNGARNHI